LVQAIIRSLLRGDLAVVNPAGITQVGHVVEKSISFMPDALKASFRFAKYRKLRQEQNARPANLTDCYLYVNHAHPLFS